jgi:hypothetical protein
MNQRREFHSDWEVFGSLLCCTKQVMEILAHRENTAKIYSVAATFATNVNGLFSKPIPKKGRVNGANSSYYK